MASIVWAPQPASVHRWTPTEQKKSPQQHRLHRPAPLRVRTQSVVGIPTRPWDDVDDGSPRKPKSGVAKGTAARNAGIQPLSPGMNGRTLSYPRAMPPRQQESPPLTPASGRADVYFEDEEDEDDDDDVDMEDANGNEQSPKGRCDDDDDDDDDNEDEPKSPRSTTSTLAPSTPITTYDFSRIDYQLERATVLGSGLWSTVYLASPTTTPRPPRSPADSNSSSTTPPATPRRTRRAASIPSRIAVKVPARRDAAEVFAREARILTRLQRHTAAHHHLVPFYGQDPRNGALLFEAVLGGSLEHLANRLQQLTEVARHVELIRVFPGLAADLVSGLAFLHARGVVHADIKSANVLLDVYESPSGVDAAPLIRARYIDFSAAFEPELVVDADGDGDAASHAHAGGTWAFLAPEQLRVREPALCVPTRASDVWSLGLTLLTVLVGGSPYAAAIGGAGHGGNYSATEVFRLREAVKQGDPLGFARADPVARKRLAACQDFVDCCRLALKKDRENRVSAEEWVEWLEER